MKAAETPPREDPALVLGLALLAFPLALVLVCWLSLACGGSVTALAALAGPLAVALVIMRMRPAGQLPLLGVAALLIAASLACGAHFTDLSWDGQAYHQPAIRALAAGWNPLWDGPLPLAAEPDNLWINHYPKGAWLAQAALVQALGAGEPAKGLQAVVLLAAALLSHAALRQRGVRPAAAAAGAGLLAGNPVALAQLPSFYLDGLNASLMTCLLALTLLLWRRPRRGLWLFVAGTLALMINLKFTGVPVVACYAAGVTGLFAATGRPWRPLLVTSASALAVGLCLLGFDPYLTNLTRHGHPFYPVRGRGAIDFLSPQLVPAFHQRGRLEQLALTLRARSSNRNEMPEPKWPLSFSADERAALAYADIRIGGFGPGFGAALLATFALALGLAAMDLRARRPLRSYLPLAGAALVILASALCNPAVWWARYVPQLWLIPAGLVVLGATRTTRDQRLGAPVRGLRYLTAALLLADLVLVAEAAGSGQRAATRALAGQLHTLAARARERSGEGPLQVKWNGAAFNAHRLQAHGIPFAARPSLPCAHLERLVGSPTELAWPEDCAPAAALAPLPPRTTGAP